MFGGIALSYSTLPLEMLEQEDLCRRVHERGGEREVQFLFRDHLPLLPVWHEGRLLLVSWGNRRGQSRRLPYTGWTWLATVKAGGWARRHEPVDVPATLGIGERRLVWVEQGVRGLLVRRAGGEGGGRVYLICKPASYYYRVMTPQPLDARPHRRTFLNRFRDGTSGSCESFLPPQHGRGACVPHMMSGCENREGPPLRAMLGQSPRWHGDRGKTSVGARGRCNVQTLWLLLGTAALGQGIRPTTARPSIEDFTLRDYRGAERRLSDWKDRRLLVVAFLGADCPLAKLYGRRLGELEKEFAAQVAVIGINANRHDSLRAIRCYARSHDLRFPFSRTATLAWPTSSAPAALPRFSCSTNSGACATAAASTTSMPPASSGTRPRAATWRKPSRNCSRASKSACRQRRR